MNANNIDELIKTMDLFTNQSMIKWTKKFPYHIGISLIIVLEELNKKGAQNQSVLAENLGYTPGAMNDMANRLINESYIRRQYDETDCRILVLEIREKGKEVLKVAASKNNELKRELFEVLTEEEVDQFLVIYKKLLRNLDV